MLNNHANNSRKHADECYWCNLVYLLFRECTASLIVTAPLNVSSIITVRDIQINCWRDWTNTLLVQLNYWHVLLRLIRAIFVIGTRKMLNPHNMWLLSHNFNLSETLNCVSGYNDVRPTLILSYKICDMYFSSFQFIVLHFD